MITSELLGPLESEVMEVMWEMNQATVRQVVNVLRERRPIAYTTVMTVMNNLVTKGLLRRTPQAKAHLYRVALSREEFWAKASEEAVSDVLNRFGDLAIARFVEAVARLKPEYLSRLQQLAERGAEHLGRKEWDNEEGLPGSVSHRRSLGYCRGPADNGAGVQLAPDLS